MFPLCFASGWVVSLLVRTGGQHTLKVGSIPARPIWVQQGTLH
jgi:hypothetical protein